MGVKETTCNSAVIGETGRFPIYLNHMYKQLKYWIRLHSCGNRLVYKAFKVQNSLYNAGHNVWVSQVYNMLHQFDMSVEVQELKKNLELIKKMMYENFVKEWKKDIVNFPILRSYILYKTSFEMEDYLLLVRDFKLRRNISKLRLSSHLLRIETGRHSKPKTDIEERICLYCDCNKIEDELHFMLECKFYDYERDCLLNKIKLIDSSIVTEDTKQTFIRLMCTKDERLLFSMAKYVTKCFKKREQK